MAKKFILIIVLAVIVIGIGCWVYQSKPKGPSITKNICTDSGGQESVSSCCASVSDFPNLCLVGACGCSPDNSHQIKTCDCEEGRCFDGKECVQQQLLISIYCVNNNCSEQQVSQGEGTLIQGCYRNLNECLSNSGSKEITACAQEQRSGDVCFDIYDPVCAKVNIQCIKAPCNPVYQTFSNACGACKNPLVESYTRGECAAAN